MFLRNGWYLAAFDDEITDNPLARTFLGEPVVLFRAKSGKVVALEDRCCHRAAPLSLGRITDRGLKCGYHGLIFNAKGECVEIPGQENIPAKARVRSYPIVEQSEFVWIWMGNAEKASQQLPVVFPHGTGSQNWPRAHALVHVKANYTLLMDNLMDLTHLPYLHHTSIGGDEYDHATGHMEVSRTPTGAKFLRLIADTPAPPRHATTYGLKGNIDRWSEFEFVVPCVILQFSGAADAGTGVIDRGVREGPHAGRMIHVLTPETGTSTHYFVCVSNRDRGMAPADAEASVRAFVEVIKEDANMVEHQQARLTGYDEQKLLDLRNDAARVQMMRALNQKIEEEKRQAQPAA